MLPTPDLLGIYLRGFFYPGEGRDAKEEVADSELVDRSFVEIRNTCSPGIYTVGSARLGLCLGGSVEGGIKWCLFAIVSLWPTVISDVLFYPK